MNAGMFSDLFVITAGLILLYLGGEVLLRGSVAIAKHLKLSNILVSAVIIGFGTSMPELSVSVGAALKGSTELALGNIVGSNIANILLIIGFAAVISPLSLEKLALRRDANMMVASTALMVILIFFDQLHALSGILMLSLLCIFIFYSYHNDKQRREHIKSSSPSSDLENKIDPFISLKLVHTPLFATIGIVIGFCGLIFGSNLIVEGAISIARGFGISETVIGLSLIALGTSLPELATAAVASFRRQGDLVIGNILGSNIFNIMAILSTTSIIKKIPTNWSQLQGDLVLMGSITLGFYALLSFHNRISRLLGVLMLVFYGAYITWLYI